MKDQRLEIVDVVRHIDDATLGKLNVPEFQRKYVWRPSKVADLVDSLWRGYPIGTLLLWESSYGSAKTAMGMQSHKLWIVDGQQRVTSLALLFGKKPFWWPDAAQWNKFYEKYDVLVNISKDKDNLEFGLTNPVRKASNEWVSVRNILHSDSLSNFSVELAGRLGNEKLFAEIHEKLQSVRKIENTPLYEIIVDHELEDVAEIFSRLNTAGTRIVESDIILALVAAKQEGWVRTKFDPFLKDLDAKGFDLDPGVVVRTLAIVGHGTARLKDVPDSFWEPSNDFDEHWRRTKEAISTVVRGFIEHGVLSSDLLPSLNVLIPVFLLKVQFSKDFNFAKAFHWLLVATRDGRYGGSATTILDRDTKKIKANKSFTDALNDLASNLTVSTTFSPDDFKEHYTDKFLRLILYLTVFNAGARDWANQDVRIGFDRENNQMNEGFKPEWHHIFPRRLMKDSGDGALVNSFANIAVLNEKANRSFGAKPPKQYLTEHKVRRERLDEQGIPTDALLEVKRFDDFIDARAKILAERATSYFQSLLK